MMQKIGKVGRMRHEGIVPKIVYGAVYCCYNCLINRCVIFLKLDNSVFRIKNEKITVYLHFENIRQFGGVFWMGRFTDYQ